MDIKQEIIDRAAKKAISLENSRYIAVWDKDGCFRAYSGVVQNLHFSVPALDKLHHNYSDVVIL